jgi:hypothetical protein
VINRELIVIPQDGETSDKYHRNRVTKRHHDNLISYIKLNDINVVVANDASIYNLGVKMANLGYVVVGTDGKQLYVFLPLTLTEEQAKWFYDYRKVVIRSEVYLVNIIKDENDDLDVQHIEEDETCISPINRLYKEIKDKTVKQEEVKVKKYGNK